MNQQQIEKYVTEYLTDATEVFLQEIVDHGIYNTGADIEYGENEDQYNAIQDEFSNQAKKLLSE